VCFCCVDVVQKLSCEASQVESLMRHGAENCLVKMLTVSDVSLLHCVLRSLINFTHQSVTQHLSVAVSVQHCPFPWGSTPNLDPQLLRGSLDPPDCTFQSAFRLVCQCFSRHVEFWLPACREEFTTNYQLSPVICVNKFINSFGLGNKIEKLSDGPAFIGDVYKPLYLLSYITDA